MDCSKFMNKTDQPESEVDLYRMTLNIINEALGIKK